MVSKVIPVSGMVHPAFEYTPTLNALMVPLLGIVLVDVKSATTLATIIINAITKAAITVFFCKAISFSSDRMLS